MRRVVVTGMGIISSIGNNLVEVTESLRNLKSGISWGLLLFKISIEPLTSSQKL